MSFPFNRYLEVLIKLYPILNANIASEKKTKGGMELSNFMPKNDIANITKI
jgi:hypothetical protein